MCFTQAGALSVTLRTMRPLARWPVSGVVLVCAIWVVLCLLVPLVWVSLKMRSAAAASSGSGGIVLVAIGINALVVILPPVLFCLAWFIARRRNRSAARTM